MIKLPEKAVQMFFQAILSEKRTSFLYGQMYWKTKSSDPRYQNIAFNKTGQYSVPY
jgi:hypothetical protein